MTRAIIDLMGDMPGMSGRQLGRLAKRSSNYIAIRLREEASFTLTDIEDFAIHLGYDAANFLGSIDRDSAAPVTPIRPEARDWGAEKHAADTSTDSSDLDLRTP